MIKILINDKCKNSINEKQLQNILKIFLKQLFEKKISISLYITDNSEIQKLNKKYRNKNSPTDILSWIYHENNLEIEGEMVISAESVREQSIVNGWDFSTELIRLLAHGCVHIAGLDHENSDKEAREMLKLEIKLLKKVGLNNIY